MSAARVAVFLDRDGTLMVDAGYLSDPSKVELLATVPQALRMLKDAAYECIVVSNQSGVARGMFTESTVLQVEAALQAKLEEHGVRVDGFYRCVHLDAGCRCRKPLPGLLETAARERGLDLAGSVMIGDRGSDIAAGHAAGMPAIFVMTGPLPYEGPAPDYTASDLLAAAEWIIARDL